VVACNSYIEDDDVSSEIDFASQCEDVINRLAQLCTW